jgi:signal transduction histidine kinase
MAKRKSVQSRSKNLPFKPRARMLLLLGDQLIRDSGIAVFELVKNAYDADATEVTVELNDVDDAKAGRIIIEDNGCGMDWDTVVNVWLEPGTDYRERQKEEGERTPKFHRFPLGEKGVGRFAAHKLGRKVKLITKTRSSPEVTVEVDWTQFGSKKYLSETNVKVAEGAAKHFDGKKESGTRIEVSDLSEALARGVVRQIQRAVTSICSPFKEPSKFTAALTITPDSSQLAGLLDIDKALESAPYRATCLVDGDVLMYDYEFQPLPGMDRVSGRKEKDRKFHVPLVDLFNKDQIKENIGPIFIEFRIFDLDSQVLQFAQSDRKGLRDFLKYNGGVRVYRDGVRVYDYGEVGNDWLSLGVRRVNHPTRHVTSNQMIGAVHIDGATSRGLVEKTNREGFIEDSNYELFRDLISFALAQIEFERNRDKERIRNAYSSKALREPVLGEVATLKSELKKYPNVETTLIPLIDSIEEQYVRMRDQLLTAAGSGLTLTVVIHEVEKAIKSLSRAIERKSPISELKEIAIHLNELIEGLTYLTRKSGRKVEEFSNLIRQAQFNTNYRTRAHGIQVFNGTETGNPDPQVKCTRRLIIATLMNLIDNSIFWLNTKGKKDKRLYLGASLEIPGGPVLFVADNGPGFQDPPELLVEPFMTRRPDGMGLGLHIANEIKKVHVVRLIFPEREDLGLDKLYTGAIVGLQFKK